MDRASDFGSEGWGFKSLRARVVMSRRPALPPHVVKVHPTPNWFARRPVRPTAEPGSDNRTGATPHHPHAHPPHIRWAGHGLGICGAWGSAAGGNGNIAGQDRRAENEGEVVRAGVSREQFVEVVVAELAGLFDET